MTTADCTVLVTAAGRCVQVTVGVCYVLVTTLGSYAMLATTRFASSKVMCPTNSIKVPCGGDSGSKQINAMPC